MKGFTTAFTVDQTPQEVFAAIDNVRGWWTGKPGAEGGTDKLGDEFTYRYDDVHYSKQKVAELVPGKKVVWHIVDARLSFTKDKTEWKGTEVIFDIAKKGAGRRYALPTRAWSPHSSASMPVRTHGALMSTTASSA